MELQRALQEFAVKFDLLKIVIDIAFTRSAVFARAKFVMRLSPKSST